MVLTHATFACWAHVLFRTASAAAKKTPRHVLATSASKCVITCLKLGGRHGAAPGGRGRALTRSLACAADADKYRRPMQRAGVVEATVNLLRDSGDGQARTNAAIALARFAKDEEVRCRAPARACASACAGACARHRALSWRRPSPPLASA